MDLLCLAKRRPALSLVSVFLVCLVEASVGAAASEPPPDHLPTGGQTAQATRNQGAHGCPAVAGGVIQKQRASEKGGQDAPYFEGVQIETTDITLYEVFFETILRAQRVQSMEHPQIDRLRGYCYRDVLIVVRQDLKAARPTGWVQLNYAVPDVAAVQQELEQSFRTSPVAQREEAERNKIVRFRLKPDVRRGDCRAVRLEVGGPEGFMIGFDQFKTGSCKPDESQAEAHH